MISFIYFTVNNSVGVYFLPVVIFGIKISGLNAIQFDPTYESIPIFCHAYESIRLFMTNHMTVSQLMKNDLSLDLMINSFTILLIFWNRGNMMVVSTNEIRNVSFSN